MGWNAYLLLICGAVLPPLVIALTSGFAIRRLARKFGLLDQPNARKVHQQPVPLGGGLAIWLGVVVSFAAGQLLLWAAAANPSLAERLPSFAQTHLSGLAAKSFGLWMLMAPATVLMLIGLWDDRSGLHWGVRLAVQFAAAAFIVYWQDARLTIFLAAPWITFGLSVLWIVGLTNSFNMLDNMDGASSGVAAIASVMLAAFLLFPPESSDAEPQLFVGGFLLVLTGALLGFLWHNRPPAKMFMGDAGAYFIGFSIAAATLLATYTTYNSSRPHAVLAPICVMAVPLYDMITVIWIRLREGASPMRADKNHFTHRLVDLGLTKGQAVLTMYLTTATCGLGALLLHRVDEGGALIVALVVICILALVNILETTARRKIKQ